MSTRVDAVALEQASFTEDACSRDMLVQGILLGVQQLLHPVQVLSQPQPRLVPAVARIVFRRVLVGIKSAGLPAQVLECHPCAVKQLGAIATLLYVASIALCRLSRLELFVLFAQLFDQFLSGVQFLTDRLLDFVVNLGCTEMLLGEGLFLFGEEL